MSTSTPAPENTPAASTPRTVMPTTRDRLAKTVCHELAEMQDHWRWFLALGIGWMALGTISLSCAPFVSFVTVALFGMMMLIGGVSQVISAFWAGKWTGFVLQVLIGILYVIVGFIVVDAPAENAVALTLVIAAFLFIGGVVRIVVSLAERFPGWGWVLLNGLVTLLLGLLIYKRWPLSGLYVIGLFVGIEMIFNGWYWVMLSIGLKKSPKIQCDE
jgi:uncharacterized membrane protein HdeD (DUF308 family)